MSIPYPTLIAALALASSVALAQTAPTNPQPIGPDTVLIENATAKVTKRDFDLEAARIAPEVRGGIYNNPRRIADLAARLLAMKTLAQQARAEGLDRDPDVAAKLALEIDRYYAQVRQSKIEQQAAAEFDAHRAQWESRAREVYAAERSRFASPEQVSASHILFSVQQHTSAEAKKLAEVARARIAGGADFNEVAKELSEDPSAKKNSGHIGFFTRAEVDPAFGAAAFALKNAGEVSEPVLSSFGWHLIKLEARKPPEQRSFDEVREQILDELRKKYATERRDAAVAAIGSDPAVKADLGALDALYERPPDEKALRAVQPGAPAPSAPAH